MQSNQRTKLRKKKLRSLDLYMKHGHDLDNIEYRCIYKANLKKTEIIANYQIAEAKGLFARLIPSRDLFTSDIYKTVEFVVLAVYMGSACDSMRGTREIRATLV